MNPLGNDAGLLCFFPGCSPVSFSRWSSCWCSSWWQEARMLEGPRKVSAAQQNPWVLSCVNTKYRQQSQFYLKRICWPEENFWWKTLPLGSISKSFLILNLCLLDLGSHALGKGTVAVYLVYVPHDFMYLYKVKGHCYFSLLWPQCVPHSASETRQPSAPAMNEDWLITSERSYILADRRIGRQLRENVFTKRVKNLLPIKVMEAEHPCHS